MANNADALYATIFDTIEKLKDKESPMDIERAKAISGVVQTAINLAKVEVDCMKVRGGNDVKFFDAPTIQPAPGLRDAGYPSPKVITHKLK